MDKIINKTTLIFFILAFLIGLGLLFYHGQAEFFFLDLQFSLSHLFIPPQTISDNLVIILIDNSTQQKLNLKPGSRFREYHAQLVEILRQAEARLIAFDMAFITEDAQADRILAEAFKKSGNVIIGEIEEDKTVRILKTNALASGSLYTQDYWQIPRQIFIHPNNTQQKAFSVEITTALETIQKTQEPFWINFSYRPDYFPVFSYIQILESDSERMADNNRTPLSFLKDKIILIGYSQEQCILPNLTGQKLPGLYAHAYAVESLLKGTHLKPVHISINILFLILTILIIQIIEVSNIKLLKKIGIWFWLICLFCFQFGVLFAHHLWLNYAALAISALSLKIMNSSFARLKNNRDFNKLKNMIKEFTLFKDGIENTLLLRDTFIDTVFHDIKNHVFSIETGIKLISARSSNDISLMKKVELIRLACQSIATLLKNLLEAKQIEDGKLKIHKSWLNSEQIMALTRKCLTDPLCEIKKLKVIIEPCRDSFKVHADIYLLERILHNLFNNAFKYSFPSGEVRLFSQTNNNTHVTETVFTLFNSSSPLTEEQKLQVFDKYYQAQSSSSPSNAYSKGLGLYFCKLAMQAHGGNIGVKSDQAGNYFYISFIEFSTDK